MGFLKHLLFWPVTGPSFLTRFSMQKVEGAVKTELTDDNAVKRELMELQIQLELGDIDEEEYVEREAVLMRKLRDVRHWKEQFGMPISGGLVKVADEARAAPEPEPEIEDRAPSVASSDEAEIDVELGFDED